jgi:hypothetical protein
MDTDGHGIAVGASISRGQNPQEDQRCRDDSKNEQADENRREEQGISHGGHLVLSITPPV